MAHHIDYDDHSMHSDNIFINEADGLSNEHPSLPEHDSDNERGGAGGGDDGDGGDIDSDSFDDLPSSIIVTNIHADVFANDDLRHEMEELFRLFSDSATFQWLKSFRRLRVNFDSGVAAANARLKLHQYPFGNSLITCYFAQPVTPVAHKYLKPPAPFKQFLISPPASPPEGWEPREEGEPLVNHDLLAALANLMPGESHELHPPTPEHPAIIVHTALVPTAANDASISNRIPHTKCPERAA